jgi:hypothetical protein
VEHELGSNLGHDLVDPLRVTDVEVAQIVVIIDRGPHDLVPGGSQ